MATYSIFGWIFTLYRAISSMIIAMVAGILTNIFDKDEIVPLQKSAFSPQPPIKQNHTFAIKKPRPMENTCSTETKSCCSSTKESKQNIVYSILNYAFGTLFKDIAKPLFWGLLLGAFISVAIPENLSEFLQSYTWLSYLIVIIIAIPMYICATASLPIAAGLMLSGVSAGAAFVFLSAGPATNTVTIGVVKKMLGTKSLFIYLGSIMLGSILFGLGLDYIFTISEINPNSLIHFDEEAGVISIVSAFILWAFILWFLSLPYAKRLYAFFGMPKKKEII